MFKEFNIQFEDVEIIGGTDNLLENTKVTKVIMRGDNKLSSLDSTFKNCSELDIIEGNINLDGVSDIDSMLENTPLVKNISFENINTDDISMNNALDNVEVINIDGHSTRSGVQGFLSKNAWDDKRHRYVGAMTDKVRTLNKQISEDGTDTVIDDSVERSATGFEVDGNTYSNLVDGDFENSLVNPFDFSSNGNVDMDYEMVDDMPVDLKEVKGNTLQNLVESGKEEDILTDTFSATLTDTTMDFDSVESKIEVVEVQGNTIQGYANVVTPNIIANHWNKCGYGTPELRLDDWIYFRGTPGGDIISNAIKSDNTKAIQLKPNTMYSVSIECTLTGSTSYIYNVNGNISLNMASKSNPTGKFTTDSTGKIGFAVRPDSESNGLMRVRVVEGDVDLSKYEYDEFDLNHIESIGELYVDEEGNPILDENGNEQYQVDVVSGNVNSWFDFAPDKFVNPNTYFWTYENMQNSDITIQGKNGTLHGSVIIDASQLKKNTFYTVGYDYENLSNSTITSLEVQTTFGFGTPNNNKLTFNTKDMTGANQITFRVNTEEANPRIRLYKMFIIEGENGEYVPPQQDKSSILLPCQLHKVGSTIDRFYWDDVKGKYIVEKNVFKITKESSCIDDFFIRHKTTQGVNIQLSWNEEDIKPASPNITNLFQGVKTGGSWSTVSPNMTILYPIALHISQSFANLGLVGDEDDNIILSTFKSHLQTLIGDKSITFYATLSTPQIIETNITEKLILDTYDTKTYISTNTINPSTTSIQNKKYLHSVSVLPNTSYTLKFNSIGKEDKQITANLGGTETTLTPTDGIRTEHSVVVKTPATLSHYNLELMGQGVRVDEMQLFQTTQADSDTYVDGIQSVGEYDEVSGKYKIDVINGQDIESVSYEGDFIDSESSGKETFEISEILGNTWQDSDDLSNIESVGELYVDEEGNPILDSEGNEQYQVDVVSSNGYNHFDRNNCTLMGGADYISNTFIEVRTGEKWTSLSGRSDGWLKFQTFDENKKLISNGFGNIQSNKLTITIPVGIKYIKPAFSTLSMFNAMTIKGDRILPYQEYVDALEHKITVLLPCQLQKVGNVADRLFWDSVKGRHVVEKKVEKKYLKDFNYEYQRYAGEWIIGGVSYGGSSRVYDMNLDDMVYNTSSNSEVVCNSDIFTVSYTTSLYNGDNPDGRVVNRLGITKKYVRVEDVIAGNTTESFQNWVGNSDICFFIPRKTPQIIETNITQPLTLPTHKDKTYITLGGLSSTIKATKHYYATHTFLLDEPLRKIGSVSDRLYWDRYKGYYCIEENTKSVSLKYDSTWHVAHYYTKDNLGTIFYHVVIPDLEYKGVSNYDRADINMYCDKFSTQPAFTSTFTQDLRVENVFFGNIWTNRNGLMFQMYQSRLDELSVDGMKRFLENLGEFTLYYKRLTPEPVIQDLPQYNEYLNFGTDIGTNYVSVSNGSVNASSITIGTTPYLYDSVRDIDASSVYTVQADVSIGDSTEDLVIKLGGTTKTVTPTDGKLNTQITTTSNVTEENNRLHFTGLGLNVNNVMLFEKDSALDVEYFEGDKHCGMLIDDKYAVNISSAKAPTFEENLEGDFITIDNSMESSSSIAINELLGNTWQDNVDSKNIFDEKVELGNIDIDGNLTSSTTLYRMKNFNLIKSSTEYFATIGTSGFIHYYDGLKNFVSRSAIYDNASFTTPSGVSYYKIRFDAMPKTKSQIEEGTVATSYEPYYKADLSNIQSVGVWNEEKQGYEIDILSTDNIFTQEFYETLTNDGSGIYSLTENGVIQNKVDTRGWGNDMPFYYLKPNTSYSLRRSVVGSIEVRIEGGTSSLIGGDFVTGETGKIKLKFNSNSNEFIINLSTSPSSVFTYPTQQHKTTILLPCQLQKVGDIADRLYWDSEKGRYAVEKNIGVHKSMPMTNSLYIGVDSELAKYLDCAKVRFNALTSHIPYTGWGTLPTTSNYGVGIYSDGDTRVYVKSGYDGSVQDCLTLLDNGSFYIYGELKTPQRIETNITQPITLPTYANKTHIFCDGTVSGTVKCTYSDGVSRVVSVLMDKPLRKIGSVSDRLYWDNNSLNFKVERNVSDNLDILDTPIIEDLVDCTDPVELFQKLPTTISCETGEIKPSNIKIEYVDIIS